MTTITTRAGKGSPLTNTEVDNNFTNLNTGKLEISGGTMTGDLVVKTPSASLVLEDNNNGAGGGAQGWLYYKNTIGTYAAIGTDSLTVDHSDMVLTNNPSSTYTDAGAISDTTSDIVLDPMTHVRIANGDLQMGSTTVIDASRNLQNIADITGSGDMVYTGDVIFKASSTATPILTLEVTNENGVDDALRIRTQYDRDVGLVFETLGGEYGLWMDSNGDDSLHIRSGSDNSANPVTTIKFHQNNNVEIPNGRLQVGSRLSSDASIISQAGNIQLRIGSTSDVHKPYIRFQGKDTEDGTAVYGDIQLDTVARKLVFNDPGTTGASIGTNPMTLDASGNLEVSGDIDLSGDLTAANVKILSSDTQPLWIIATDNVASRGFQGALIDMNVSGSDAIVGADYTHTGFEVDVDSSATGGDTSNEHRLYGARVDVRASGDSDLIAGGYFYAEAQLSSGTTTNLYGSYSYAISDPTLTGRVANVFGAHNLAYIGETGAGTGTPLSVAYGSFNKALVLPSQERDITKIVGVYAEVELDNATDPANSGTVSTLMGVSSVIDNDSGVDTFAATNSYLFYGGYQGTIQSSTDWYGVYISSDVPNYFAGEVDANFFQVGGTTVIDNLRGVHNITSLTVDGRIRLEPTGTATATDYYPSQELQFATSGWDTNHGERTGRWHVRAESTPSAFPEIDLVFYEEDPSHGHHKMILRGRGSGGSYLDAVAADFYGNVNVNTTVDNTGGNLSVAGYVRIEATSDVSHSSEAHAFQIGLTSAANIAMDTNEIIARDNGAESPLHLNTDGGDVTFRNNLTGTSNLVMSGTTFLDQDRNATLASVQTTKLFTDGNTLDISVDDNGNGTNQQIRFSEGGVVRMVLEDNDLYVHDNISAGRKYEAGGANQAYDITSSTVNAYSGTAVDGSGTEYRTFIQSYNTTDPDVAVFQAFSKDVMADTGATGHDAQSTAVIADNGGRFWTWQSQYAGRVRVGTTATTTAYRAADSTMTAYSGTGNAHGHTTYAGYTTIAGRETANGDDVFAHYNEGQFRIEFDASGNGRFDGGADISAADYAEYFEWADGNPNDEDRRGYPVVLTADGKIRIATASDPAADFLGIVSVEAAVVGDSAWAAWTGKYERDRFGQTVYEDYELLCWGPYDEDSKSYKTQTTRQAMIDAGREADIPEDAITVTKRRQKLSASYDPTHEYIPRKDRPEWQAIGLMGKLPLLAGQPTAPQWRKLFDLNDEVEMWLVR